SDEVLPEIRRRLVYFKIHGSLEPSPSKYDGSVIFSLRHETILPDWKRQLLRQLLDGRQLVVLGYSGSDFEICPELQKAGASRILWLFRDGCEVAQRNNVRHLLSRVEGTVIVGDIVDFLSVLSGNTIAHTKWDPHVGRLTRALRSACSNADLLEWRARLSVGMGCAIL